MTTLVDVAGPRPLHLEIQTVSVLRPFAWLWRGATDLVACAPGNLAHGLLMAAVGWVLLLMLGNHSYFVAAAVTGFLLGAPVMATGLCELSRRRQAGQSVGFDDSLGVLRRDGRTLFKFGLMLAVLAIVWFAMSELMLREVFDVPAQSVADTYYSGFVDTANRSQMMSYVAVGGLLALVVFVVSVVSVPLIIDRQARASQAVRASMLVVRENPLAMIVWAALLVGLTALGFATLLIGMIVIIPLLGHATWHAYRELIR